MEKANPLIETEDDNSEQLTGGGALSGTVPSASFRGASSVFPERAFPERPFSEGRFSGGGSSDDGSSEEGPAEGRSSERAERGGSPFSRASTTQLSPGMTASSSPRSSGMQARSAKAVDSGVFSGLPGPVTGEQLAESLQSALSAASRGEAGLGSLHRSVRDASRALTSLRHSHESLGDELRLMYRGLNEVMSEKAAVERYAALLTQERDAALDAAEEARREAKRERDFLLHEQDRFIQLLLEEHEAELQQLRRALSGRSSAPPPVAVLTEPTTGFRIGVEVKSGEHQAPSEELEPSAAPQENELEATLRSGEAVRHEQERRALVPMPRPELESAPLGGRRNGGVPLGRLQLAPSEPPAAGTEDEPAGTERGVGERDLLLDRSLTERHLLDTLRSEAPAADAGGRAGTYPPPPAVLDLDSLAAEVEGNSERPPPIRRIGVSEPTLHLEPARVPTRLFETLMSRSDGREPDHRLQDEPRDTES